MKKVFVLCFVVLVILLPAFLFINNCGPPQCTIPTGPDYYHIGFTLDGFAIDEQDIILNFGCDSEDPWIVLRSEITFDSMEIDGWYCRGGDIASFPTFKVHIGLYSYTPGVYEGYVGSGLTITEDDIEYEYTTSDATLTITSFGDVGGDVVGTFDFTYESTNPAPSFSTPLTATGGGFRVLRIPDRQ
jgi:hypothetical protein